MTARTTTTFLILLLLLTPGRAFAQRLQLDSLDGLAKLAVDSVNIDIDQGMLAFAGAFLKGGADEADVKKLISGLKGIYIRSFEFNRDVDVVRDLDPVRRQLTGKGWTRVIGVDSKGDREFVEVYSWRDGNASGGLAILTAQPNEITVVNVVGLLDLAQLAALRGLGVPEITVK